jgi:acetate kinase
VSKALLTAGCVKSTAPAKRGGPRDVHGGPENDKPVLINAEVLARLEGAMYRLRRCTKRNLAPIRSLLASFPKLPHTNVRQADTRRKVRAIRRRPF